MNYDGALMVTDEADVIDELPLPEEDGDLVDLQFIHWGYLNCCQLVSKGKKAKKEFWNTYWIDLCGSTVRFYKDASLPADSAMHPPPVTQYGALQENESKVAFFDLENGETKVLDDGRVFRRKMPKSIYSKVYRRHLFKVKFNNIKTLYVFQASSHSSMLRWVSKIQESIDAKADNRLLLLCSCYYMILQKLLRVAEERLKLARFMMEKNHRDSLTRDGLDLNDNTDDLSISDTVSLFEEAKGKTLNPRQQLKKQLAEKREFLWQLEHQIIDFLGNKGEFRRKEFICSIKQDYYLVPGRMGTYIPAGTNVTIFGKLPNRRWRCLVEMDELIKSMNGLVRDLQNIGSDNKVDARLSNLPDYPLIGCLPESVLDVDFGEYKEECEERALQTPSPIGDVALVEEGDERSEGVCSPYSGHKRSSRTAPVKAWGVEVPDKPKIDDDSDDVDAFTPPVPAIVLPEQDEEYDVDDDDINDVMDGDENEEYDIETDDDLLDGPETNSFMRRWGSGIVIKKKLRQKGISIIVGSSSSEGEEDEEGSNENEHNDGVTNAVYKKFVPSNLPDDNDNYAAPWNAEDKSYIRNRKKSDLKTSFSCDHINYNGEFTTKPDLLRHFGQKSINLEENKELAKVLIQVFDDTKKGPDVKPPLNERRTLKLSKNDEQGFGFWLQTYGFGKQKETVQKRTFVRYVEDEGPAYLAGLREGDIIVEVNGCNVEEIDHLKIVQYITEAKLELILVVKFIDAVRRVELGLKLKKRQTKLKTKFEELRKIKDEEHAVLMGMATPLNSEFSVSTDVDVDRLSLNTSTESELSSMSSLSDEVVVRTSKFEQRSSRVLDSIKELNCIDSVSASNSTSDLNLPHITTENELLNLYSNHIDGQAFLTQFRTPTVKRTESMPVQKYQTLPRYKAVIDLDGNQAREYSIENSMVGHIQSESFSYSSTTLSDDEDDDYNDDDSDELSSSQTGLSRKSRPKSYKLAMKLKQRKGDEIIDF